MNSADLQRAGWPGVLGSLWGASVSKKNCAILGIHPANCEQEVNKRRSLAHHVSSRLADSPRKTPAPVNRE